MTLLSMCTAALEEIGEFSGPSTIVGNANRTATQILALANVEGRALSRRHGWEALVVEKAFTTTADQAIQTSGAPPANMRFILNATWWDRTNFWPLRGPATAEEWQALQSGIVTSTVRRWYRILAGDFLVFPDAPNSTDIIVYEYISKNFCQSSGGTGQSAWADDTDTGILDEELMQMGLVWRFLKSKGLPYEEEFNAYELEVRRAIAHDGGAPILNLAVRNTSYLISTANVPDTGIGS